MTGKKLGDMTPAERAAAVRRAAARFQAEMDRAAPAIAAVLSQDISLPAELALLQEAGYQARQPQRAEETDAELAARGCAYHTTLRPGSRIYCNGRSLGDDGKFMIIEQRPVTILTEGMPDTTSDPFGRTLTRYRARDELSGREGNLTYGARGVVRIATSLPYFPLATSDI